MNKRLRNLTKTSFGLMVALVAVACVFTASSVYATFTVTNEAQPNFALASVRMVEMPDAVVMFNDQANKSSVGAEVAKVMTTEISYTNQDYVEAANAGVISCADNASFTAGGGCVCDAGFSGDGKTSCVENPVETFAASFDGDGWASVTLDVSNYWSDNAIVNAALSLVGSSGYACNQVVDYALSAIGWNGSYFNGVEVGLEGMVPGDVIIYPSHYALYVGDGKAVHGGYNGSNVILGDVVVGKVPYTAYHCQ